MGIDSLLSLLPPGSIMAFLLAAASVWLILQVAKEDSKYPKSLRTVLLSIAWPIFILSAVVFIGLFVLALIPVALSYSIVIPKVNIDPSIFVLYALIFVFTVLVSLGSSYVIRKLHRYLPKTAEEKRIKELSEEVTKNVKEGVEYVQRSSQVVDRAFALVEKSTDQLEKSIDLSRGGIEAVIESGELIEYMTKLTKNISDHVEKLPKKRKTANTRKSPSKKVTK
jgi:hypothetical protein